MAAAPSADIIAAAANRQSQEKDPKFPSIFDYLAQDSLRVQMKPGIRAALKLFIERFPGSKILQFIERHFDSLFLLLEASVESYYLRKFSGSFTENFYGMKRVPTRGSNSSFLSFGHRIRSLITLVLFPYIAERVQRVYDRLKEQQPLDAYHRIGWRRLLLRFFPHLKAAFLFSILFYQIGYTFAWLRIPSWLLLVSGARLEMLNAEDFVRFEASGRSGTAKSLMARCWRLFFWFPSTIGTLLSYGLFLLQFLELYYTDELGQQFARIVSGGGPNENHRVNFQEFPIEILPSEQRELCLAGKCPLCRRVRDCSDEAVLSVSGYVFCHPCIIKFVALNGRCPVTSLPASSKEIVKLFR